MNRYSKAKLPPKERALLSLLTERAPKAVSKEEIINKVWHGLAGVSDDSLARCISQLRQLLPDLKIEAEYGYGYRLIEPSSFIHDRAAEAGMGPPPIVELHQHALQLANNGTLLDIQRALNIFRQIINKQENYAPARISLINTIGIAMGFGLCDEINLNVSEAWEQLAIISETTPKTSGLAAATAWLNTVTWKFNDAEKWYDTALHKEGAHAEILHQYAWHLTATGRVEQALAVIQKVVEQYPYAPYHKMVKAHLLGVLERYDEALESLLIAKYDHPDSLSIQSAECYLLACAYPCEKLIPRAHFLSQQMSVLTYGRVCYPFVLARCGHRDQAIAEINLALEENSLSIGRKVGYVKALLEVDQPEEAAKIIAEAHSVNYGWLPLAFQSPRISPVIKHPIAREAHKKIYENWSN